MDFKEYQDKSRETWINNKYNLIRSILGLCGESGEIAEKIKKEFRGDKKVTKTEMLKELGDVFYYVARIADYFKLDLEEIAKQNIIKLTSRKKRGKIKGSGDLR